MKKILTLSAALLLCASIASAQAVYLGLNDCTAGPSVAHAFTNACTSNSGTAGVLYGSCVPTSQVEVQFVGAQSVLDIQSSLSATPDWWRADACRSTGFSMAADALSIGGSCATLWDNAPPAGSNLTALNGVGGANRIRFLLGTVLDATVAATTNFQGDGATEYSAWKLTIGKTKSTGTGSCAGCSAGACLVLNEINLQTLTDTPATYERLTDGSAGLNFVTYQTGAPVCAGSTPTQNHTWGSIKALYR